MKKKDVFGLLLGLLVVASAWGQPAMDGQGLKGEYYRGLNFEKKVFTRTDARIDFDWRGRTPGRGMPPSVYSIRWTGKLYAPVSGVYRFTATVDDGIRLWVGGRKILDDWKLNDSKTLVGVITLKAGEFYDLRVDYFNDILEGQIRLFWITPRDNPASSGKLISSDVFYKPDFQPPKPVVEEPPKPVVVKKSVPVEKPKPRPVVAREVRVPKPKDSMAVAKVLPKPIAEPVSKPKPAVSTTEVPKTVTPAPIKNPTTASTTGTSIPGKATTTASIPEVSTPAAPVPGTAIALNPILFEQSDYHLLPQSQAELNKLVAILNQYPTIHLEIAGHTDNVGDPRLNLALSENRARVIATYLTRNGIRADRIDAKGYGGTRPIADNSTEIERAKNRRVEFTVR